MARKKRGKSRRSRGRKGRKGRKSVGSSKVPAAVGAGALVSMYKLLLENGAPIVYLAKNPNTAGLNAFTAAETIRVKNTDTWLPLAAGMAVHWGKNKPVLSIVGRPLDQLSKKVLKRPL